MSATRSQTYCERCAAPTPARNYAGHSFGKLLASLPLYCDKCVADLEAQDAAQESESEARDRSARLTERIVKSGLPSRHHGASLNALQHSNGVLSTAHQWAEKGGGLLLTGPVGAGKTTIAGAAAWRRLQRGRLFWTTAPLLMARLGSGLSTPARTDALVALSSSDPLVLDDIDKARPTEYGAEQIFLAVDYRVEHKSPLLVTSNLQPSELATRWPEPYGPAIASRLVGYCQVVKVSGPDRRLS